MDETTKNFSENTRFPKIWMKAMKSTVDWGWMNTRGWFHMIPFFPCMHTFQRASRSTACRPGYNVRTSGNKVLHILRGAETSQPLQTCQLATLQGRIYGTTDTECSQRGVRARMQVVARVGSWRLSHKSVLQIDRCFRGILLDHVTSRVGLIGMQACKKSLNRGVSCTSR